jgi:hypothetical protein
MDDGRPLKAKVPHILNSNLLLLLHLNLKKGREMQRRVGKGLSEKFTNTKLSIEFQVTRDVMRDDE